MNKAIKVRIYPTPEQAEFLNRQYKRHGRKLKPKKDLKPLLAVAKKSRKYHWLKDFDSIALQQACINLDKAFQSFFDPKLPSRYPKFKRKHSRQSSYHCMSVDYGDDWIKVPKLKQPIRARIHRKIEGKLKSITLSRCQKGSRGRAKARLKLAKAHQRLANARADFQHKLSRQLIDESQAVIVETLKVKNMLKNKKLSKHIADASWSGLIQKLEYKSKEQGKHLIKIDQWFASSKTCSCCGHKLEELSLNVRDWHCPACSTQHCMFR